MSQGDVFVGVPPSENLYITITDASHQRAIVVTHVWLATDPRVDVLDQALAKRLEYGDVWETWVPMSKIPEGTDELEGAVAGSGLAPVKTNGPVRRGPFSR